MNPGDKTLELLRKILDEGATHVTLLMRHSAREFEPGRHDLLNPLTDEGRDLARDMGKRLPKSLIVRGYSSPAERCVETADLIMEAHGSSGGRVTRNRPAEALGVFYVLDQMRMFKAMQAEGGQVPLIEKWFKGGVGLDVLMPAEIAARLVAGFAAARLKEPLERPQLDLLVSHDMTLYTVRDRMLSQSAADHGDIGFLDGLALFERDGQLFMQSHHAGPVAIDVE
jgi:broad specificity phosphatase PhoE